MQTIVTHTVTQYNKKEQDENDYRKQRQDLQAALYPGG